MRQFCEACGLDLASELDDRERAVLFLNVASAALSLGALIPFAALFALGQLDRGLFPVAGVVIALMCLAGITTIYARRMRPEYLDVRSKHDLRDQSRR